MNVQRSSTNTREHPNVRRGSQIHLRGQTLVLARSVWVLLTIGMLTTLIPSIQAYYHLQQRVCDRPATCLLFNQATPSKLQALQHLGLSLDDFALYTVCMQVVVTVICLGMGTLLFLRKSNTWLGLLASFFLLLLGCSGIFQSLNVALGITNLPLVSQQLVSLVYGLADPALGVFLLIFPTGRFTPRWSWLIGLLWATNIVSFDLPAPYTFFYWPPALQASDILLEVGGMIVIQVYRYRWVYTLTERQQAKWLFFGFAGGGLSFVFFYFVLPAIPGLNAPASPLQLLDSLGTALLYSSIPIGVGIAILRYRLWGIDALINKTLVYGLLTGILGILYVGLILALETLTRAIIGQTGEQPVVLVVSTLLIAALFQPLRKGIQTTVDRRFYRHKYSAEKTLATFSATLRQEVDLKQLEGHLLNVVQETMHPTHVSLWLRKDDQRRKLTADAEVSPPVSSHVL